MYKDWRFKVSTDEVCLGMDFFLYTETGDNIHIPGKKSKIYPARASPEDVEAVIE